MNTPQQESTRRMPNEANLFPTHLDPSTASAKAIAEEVDLFEAARRSHDLIARGWSQALAELGIKGKPVSPDALKEMMRASGCDPSDNPFAREIAAMREE